MLHLQQMHNYYIFLHPSSHLDQSLIKVSQLKLPFVGQLYPKMPAHHLTPVKQILF